MGIVTAEPAAGSRWLQEISRSAGGRAPASTRTPHGSDWRPMHAQPLRADADAHPDDEVVDHVIDGELHWFAVLMRRYNRRLFRVVRAIVQNDAEAEDACQDAWLRAYRHLQDLRHGTAFSRWIGRIGLRCALERRRLREHVVSLDELDDRHADGATSDPDGHVEGRELAHRIERALDELAPSYRAIVLLRDFEHMTTTETAAILGLTEQNVRVRLHRARACLRQRLTDDLGPELDEVFRFDGDRCGRLTQAVMAALTDPDAHSDSRYATRSARSPSSSPSSSSST
jgi:RNA polymerase sigma-70 factor (ECF subfamily)